MNGPTIPGRQELEENGINIMVGIPMERTVDSAAIHGLWSVARHGYHLAPLGYGRTDKNRNLMGHAMIGSEFTHICMLDLDHWHTGNMVGILARWILEDPERLIVAGLNYRRTPPHNPLIFEDTADGSQLQVIEDPPEDQLIEVEATGHGSIIISREVFERIPPPWWAYPYNLAEAGTYPSEDMFFCMRARMDGIKIHVDTSAMSPHLTQQWITGEQWANRRSEASKTATTPRKRRKGKRGRA